MHHSALAGSRLSRRAVLRLSALLAVGSVLAACAPAAEPTPTPAPAKPAAQPTPTPAAPKPAQPAQPTPTPAAQPKPVAKVPVKGKFQVYLIDDYHPDHNAHVKKTIEEFAKAQGWPIEISPVAAFLAGADIYQKLLAVVQAGDPPDIMIHGLSTRQLQLLGVGETVDDVMKDLMSQYGKVMPGSEAALFHEGKWWGVPFYGRTGGYWARRDVFAKHGIDIDKDLETWDQVREACLKVSDPANKMWGWGMTVNRSGDGESLVWDIIWHWGGALTDESGQIVTLNSPETVAGIKWLAEVYLDKKWEKMLPPGVNSWTDPSNNEAYLAGTIPFTSNAGTLYAKAVVDKVPFWQEIKLIQKPYGPIRKRFQGAGSNNFYLFKGVKNRDAAVALIQHMMSPEQQRPLWKISQGYVVPPFRKMWDDPVLPVTKLDENNKRFEPIAWHEPPFRGVAHRGPLSAAADAVSRDNVATDMMGQILKGKPVEQAVKEAHDRCVKIFKEFGLKGE